jgi:hypothetical protein
MLQRPTPRRKQDPVLFRNGGWGFERTYTVSSELDGRYISIVRSDYVNTGGAHPSKLATFLNFGHLGLIRSGV